jgi:hypothetical protein
MRVKLKIIREGLAKRPAPARRITNKLAAIATALEAGGEPAQHAAAIRRIVTQLRRAPGRPGRRA